MSVYVYMDECVEVSVWGCVWRETRGRPVERKGEGVLGLGNGEGKKQARLLS